MSRKYKISEKAKDDLEKIWFYTLNTWSLKQADRYINLLIEEIEYINNYFESGKDMDHIRRNYKASKVKSHIIFYRKSEEGIIEIIRVLHQRMDIESRLGEM